LATAMTLVGTGEEYWNRGADSSFRGGEVQFPLPPGKKTFAGFCPGPAASYCYELDPFDS
jgi:hypothetical protein